ncbi:uncharacterized protein isoform X2 [Rhodnius prolixus]|uniref:uncharacterized protein isoform X2 n=1 Tax=Rhodnius prolixus TaxID=13249 RepID=UPI003D18A208
MCRTTLTFLIAFPFQVNPSLDATKGKKKKKEKKEKKVKHHDKEEPPLDPHFLACDPKMKYSCTIQYKLMANMDTSVSVTVICWGRVSKIYLKDQVKAIKNVIRNNVAWVAFSISHKVKPPKTTQLQKFISHLCEFTYTQNPEAIGSKTVEGEEQLFYSFKEGENCENEFEEVSPTTMNEVPKQPAITKKEKYLLTGNLAGTSSRLQAIPCHLHRRKVIEKIHKSKKILIELGLPVPPEVQAELERELHEAKKPKKKEKAAKKKNKKKSKKEVKEPAEVKNLKEEHADATHNITISGGEILFDNPTWHKEKYNISSYILYAGVWLTTDTLLTQDVRDGLKPIGIRINKLKDMPLRDPAYRRCKSITIEYSMGDVIKSEEILPVPVERFSKKVVIDNTQVFLTDLHPPEQLIESFQTSKLFIRIFGYFVVTADTQGAIFTQDRNDDIFSNRMVARVAPDFDLEKKYSINPAISELEYDENRLEKVFLGSAEVDCKDLLGKNYRIDVCAPIMSGAIMKENHLTIDILENFNTLNVYDDVNIVKGILDDGKLIENNSSVKVTIKLMCSLKTTILHALENRKLTRLFVAINDTKISSKLLKTIIFHNGNIIGKSLIVPKVPFYQGDYIKSNFPVKKGENYLEKTELKHLITGFTVDTLDAFLFFAEGLAEDISAEVWNIVFSLQTSQGFVLYNSDLSFGQVSHGTDYSQILKYFLKVTFQLQLGVLY